MQRGRFRPAALALATGIALVVAVSVACYFRVMNDTSAASNDSIMSGSSTNRENSRTRREPPLWKGIKTSKNYTNVEWTAGSEHNLLQIVTKNKVPVVISNGPGMMWGEVSSKWNMQQLFGSDTDNDLVILPQCRKHISPLFVLEREKDKGGMIGQESHTPVQYADISLSEFLKSMKENDRYLYWTGLLSHLTAYSTGRSISHKEFVSRPKIGDLSRTHWQEFHVLEPELAEGLPLPTDDFWEPMLWFSQPGVVAQTHFDSQHNFFTVIFGVRRFTFFSPSLEMHPYPSIHRSNRQSQLHLELEDDASILTKQLHNATDSSDSSHSLTFQIDVAAGQTLYIPPYWYHHVETLSPSLGVSVNSPTREEAILQQAYWHTVPLGGFRTAPLRMSAAKYFLDLLVRNVCNISVQQFAEGLYLSRFSILFPHESTDCGILECESETRSSEAIAKLATTADSISSIIEASTVTADIKKIFLSDYVEQMSRWAVGPNYTASYIYCCLTAIS